ncbi:MAG: BclA C-terminal domain-containing protein, partial [Bacilli bacterium]
TGNTGATGILSEGYAYAGNDSGAVIAVVVAGTDIPLPSNQTLSNVTVDGTDTTFTISNAGTYLLSYAINTTTALSVSARLVINGSANGASTLTPSIATSSLNGTIITTLTTNDTVKLQLFGLLGSATLISSGQGASISIVRIAD